MPGHNQPRFQVTLDGRDLTDRIAPRLLSLSLTEKRGTEADQLELVIEDHDGAIAIPKPDVVIRLSLGWDSGPDVTPGLVGKGAFKVDEAEWSGAPDVVTVRARSANLSGEFRRRREGSWRDTTLGAIVGDIAQRSGVTAQVSPELASIPYPVLGQDQRSDMALIRFLGERHDAMATVKNGVLLFAPIGTGRTASGRAIPAATLTRRSGDKYSYRRAARDSHDGVEARWHDPDRAERRTVRVGGSSGQDGSPPRRLRRTFPTETSARQAAESEERRVKRAAAEFEINLALGDPTLYPDRPVQLQGFKPEIDGQSWLIAEVVHSIDSKGGFGTRLKLEVKA